MSVKTSKWEVSEYLSTPEDIVDYLNAVIAENDLPLLQAALGDVAKAQGMTKISREAGVGRESLYKALSTSGSPSFKTMVKVMQAIGVQFVFEPAHHLAPLET
jgi:probable addiction module antidote protein